MGNNMLLKSGFYDEAKETLRRYYQRGLLASKSLLKEFDEAYKRKRRQLDEFNPLIEIEGKRINGSRYRMVNAYEE